MAKQIENPIKHTTADETDNNTVWCLISIQNPGLNSLLFFIFFGSLLLLCRVCESIVLVQHSNLVKSNYGIYPLLLLTFISVGTYPIVVCTITKKMSLFRRDRHLKNRTEKCQVTRHIQHEKIFFKNYSRHFQRRLNISKNSRRLTVFLSPAKQQRALFKICVDHFFSSFLLFPLFYDRRCCGRGTEDCFSTSSSTSFLAWAQRGDVTRVSPTVRKTAENFFHLPIFFYWFLISLHPILY